jgi:hypothetical protein
MKTSFKVTILKQTVLVLLIVVTGLLISTELFAQDSLKLVKQQNESCKPDSEEIIQKEYNTILKKYRVNTIQGRQNLIQHKIEDSDKDRLEFLYNRMKKKQQDQQVVSFPQMSYLYTFPIPKMKEFEKWKNPKIIVRINDKKVDNAVLNQYKNTDLYLLAKRKLDKNKINSGNVYTQVDLWTKAYYKRYCKAIQENKKRRKEKSFMQVKWFTHEEEERLLFGRIQAFIPLKNMKTLVKEPVVIFI